MMPVDRIFKIGAIILQDGKLLVVRKQTADNRTECIIPGGRVEGGETPRQTLDRELQEELGVQLTGMEHFGSFDDIAVFENVPIHMEVYIVTISGTPSPHSEIKEYLWVGQDYTEQGIILGSVLTRHVVPELVRRGTLI